MIQTLEFPASELAEKIQRGEILPTTRLQMQIDIHEPLSNEEIARRLEAWRQFVAEHSVSGATLNVSRESFYEGDTDW